MVSSSAAGVAWRSLAAAGSAGTKMCMPTGPLKVSKPRSQSEEPGVGDEFHRAADRLRSAVSGSRIRQAHEPIPHGFEQAKRTRQILIRHLAEDEVANVLRYALDLIDCPTSARRQHKALRAPVSGVLASLDEARIFERVEQANDRRPIERQGSGQLILPHRSFGPRDPKQGQPGRFRQPIDLQTPVDRTPPFARDMGDERRESSSGVFCRKRHGRSNRWHIN